MLKAMRLTNAHSVWQSIFATILVVLLALGSSLQAQAAASHADHVMIQMPTMEANAQHEDCCADGESAAHAVCGTCVLPCMTPLQALLDTPLMAAPVGVSLHHALDGQVPTGLSTAPDFRPPKTSS